jgi:hypothetical protein
MSGAGGPLWGSEGPSPRPRGAILSAVSEAVR